MLKGLTTFIQRVPNKMKTVDALSYWLSPGQRFPHCRIESQEQIEAALQRKETNL